MVASGRIRGQSQASTAITVSISIRVFGTAIVEIYELSIVNVCASGSDLCRIIIRVIKFGMGWSPSEVSCAGIPLIPIVVTMIGTVPQAVEGTREVMAPSLKLVAVVFISKVGGDAPVAKRSGVRPRQVISRTLRRNGSEYFPILIQPGDFEGAELSPDRVCKHKSQHDGPSHGYDHPSHVDFLLYRSVNA